MAVNRLRAPQLRAWDEQGFFISDLVIDRAVIEDMRAGFERVFNTIQPTEHPTARSWKPGDAPDRIRQVGFAWRLDPVLRSSALTREIGAIAAQLVRSDGMRLLMDWIVHKPGIGSHACPRTGVGFHQDLNYWQSFTPASLLTARIPLDEETTANGCMTVFPGSHRLGLLPGLGDGFWTSDESGQSRNPTLDALGYAPTPCELETGRVMFHHCLLVHGTGQNRTDRPRRSQNIHMMPGDTVYRAGKGRFFEDYAACHGRTLPEGQIPEGQALFPFSWRARPGSVLPRFEPAQHPAQGTGRLRALL